MFCYELTIVRGLLSFASQQSLEQELTQLKASKSESLQQYMADHEREINAMRSQHQSDLDSIRSSHEVQLASQSKALSQQYEAIIGDLRAQAAAFPKKLADSLAEAKSKVYDKVKIQFENGNKEFQKVKQALKDAQTDAEIKATENQSLKQSNAQLNALIVILKEDAAQVVGKLVSAQNVILDVVKVVSPSLLPSGSVSVSAAALLAPEVISQHGLSITDAVKRLQSELMGSQTTLASTRAVVGQLESSLRAAECTISTVSSRATEQEDRAGVAEALLSTVRCELDEVRSDRDLQMLAVAKLASANASLEDSVVQLKADASETSERCHSLRAMNEELLMMMEKSFSPPAQDSL